MKRNQRIPVGMKKVDSTVGEMHADDRAKSLPEFLQVIDAKHGNFIGWLKREEVTEQVNGNKFYRFEADCNPPFVLYNFDWAKQVMEVEAESLASYISAIRNFLPSAMDCDDPMHKRLGVGYVSGGTNFVCYLPLSMALREREFLTKEIRRALERGHTQGLIDLFHSRAMNRAAAEPKAGGASCRSQRKR